MNFGRSNLARKWGVFLRDRVVGYGGWECVVLCREKEHLDVREAMQRQHIANEHKYSQAIRELQAKVR